MRLALPFKLPSALAAPRVRFCALETKLSALSHYQSAPEISRGMVVLSIKFNALIDQAYVWLRYKIAYRHPDRKFTTSNDLLYFLASQCF